MSNKDCTMKENIKFKGHIKTKLAENCVNLAATMATHSSVLAWRIPGMGDPGGLLSLGSHRVGHDWSNLAAAAAFVLRQG